MSHAYLAYEKELDEGVQSNRKVSPTVILAGFMMMMILYLETTTLLGASEVYDFAVDKGVTEDIQVNLDLTVAAPCNDLDVYIRDVSGDRLFVSELIEYYPLADTEDQSSSLMAGSSWLQNKGPVDYQGKEWCRMRGIFSTHKVQGVLVVQPKGTGFFHTQRAPLNLTHGINELSFGFYYSSIRNPLDETVLITEKEDDFFVYFLNIIPTTWRALGLSSKSYQYTTMETSKSDKRGIRPPGIYFEYNFEAIAVTITDSRMSFLQWIFRIANIVGGVAFAVRWANRRWVAPATLEHEDDDHHGGEGLLGNVS